MPCGFTHDTDVSVSFPTLFSNCREDALGQSTLAKCTRVFLWSYTTIQSMNITSWCHLIGACHIVVLETVSGSCVIEVRRGRCGTYIQLVKVYVYGKLICHSSLQKTTHVTHRNKFLELYVSQEIECFARVIIRGVRMVKFSYQITVQLTSVYFTFGETDKTG